MEIAQHHLRCVVGVSSGRGDRVESAGCQPPLHLLRDAWPRVRDDMVWTVAACGDAIPHQGVEVQVTRTVLEEVWASWFTGSERWIPDGADGLSKLTGLDWATISGNCDEP